MVSPRKVIPASQTTNSVQAPQPAPWSLPDRFASAKQKRLAVLSASRQPRQHDEFRLEKAVLQRGLMHADLEDDPPASTRRLLGLLRNSLPLDVRSRLHELQQHEMEQQQDDGSSGRWRRSPPHSKPDAKPLDLRPLSGVHEELRNAKRSIPPQFAKHIAEGLVAGGLHGVARLALHSKKAARVSGGESDEEGDGKGEGVLDGGNRGTRERHAASSKHVPPGPERPVHHHERLLGAILHVAPDPGVENAVAAVRTSPTPHHNTFVLSSCRISPTPPLYQTGSSPPNELPPVHYVDVALAGNGGALPEELLSPKPRKRMMSPLPLAPPYAPLPAAERARCDAAWADHPTYAYLSGDDLSSLLNSPSLHKSGSVLHQPPLVPMGVGRSSPPLKSQNGVRNNEIDDPLHAGNVSRVKVEEEEGTVVEEEGEEDDEEEYEGDVVWSVSGVRAMTSLEKRRYELQATLESTHKNVQRIAAETRKRLDLEKRAARRGDGGMESKGTTTNSSSHQEPSRFSSMRRVPSRVVVRSKSMLDQRAAALQRRMQQSKWSTVSGGGAASLAGARRWSAVFVQEEGEADSYDSSGLEGPLPKAVSAHELQFLELQRRAQSQSFLIDAQQLAQAGNRSSEWEQPNQQRKGQQQKRRIAESPSNETAKRQQGGRNGGGISATALGCCDDNTETHGTTHQANKKKAVALYREALQQQARDLAEMKAEARRIHLPILLNLGAFA